MMSWEAFFRDKVRIILTEKQSILDIGGGLRAWHDRGNCFNAERFRMFGALLEKVDYKVLDPVLDYNPDIIGDIHDLPFGDSSLDAILCIAVLEHVEDPIRACQEMHRVLNPGDTALSTFLFCTDTMPMRDTTVITGDLPRTPWRFCLKDGVV